MTENVPLLPQAKYRESQARFSLYEDLHIQQAVVLIEDAIHYRSINHRMDSRSVRIYRLYYSRAYQWGLNVVIALVLGLAFIERPSSFSLTSDLRYKRLLWEPSCGLVEVFESLCLLVLAVDLGTKFYLLGRGEFLKCKWLIGYLVVILLSVIDWAISLEEACKADRISFLRVRKLLRPFFLLQNSSLMKKTLKCIKRTLPEITSVFVLVLLHLCVFTMLGMLLFAKRENPEENREWELYFRNLAQSLTSLLVLLTTANNPDVMTPAYSLNRGFSAFFILFTGFGTYFLMNLLTAIVYNQFRGYLMMSVQASILRRRLGIRAAFQLLHTLHQDHQDSACPQDSNVECVSVEMVLKVMRRVQMENYYRNAIMKKASQLYSVSIPRKGFQGLFEELDKERIKERVLIQHHVTVVGNIMALANVLCICVFLVIDAEKSQVERQDHLETINCFFIVYYVLEGGLKTLTLGWRGYIFYGSNVFDGVLTLALLALQISILAAYRLPLTKWNPDHSGIIPLWTLVCLINMLIVVRLLRIIANIKLMSLVTSTLVDMVKNLRAFAGILVVVYYVFAMLGVWLFRGAIAAPANVSGNGTPLPGILKMVVNVSVECGTYEQLGYWSNNFDDFASALVLLYNIMVVNNWNVFLDVYSRNTSEWSKLYFVAWWLTSSVMWVNLFVALILENFIYKWDHARSGWDAERADLETTVQLMFRDRIPEPTEEEVVLKLHQHPHLQL
ncbi:two pore channel protein 2-like [Aplochiton taeniatus]